MRREPKHPRTKEEWQLCVDGCKVAFILDSMFQYGLITPEPKVNIPRCQWLMNVGNHKGYYPIEENVISLLREFISIPQTEDNSNAI